MSEPEPAPWEAQQEHHGTRRVQQRSDTARVLPPDSYLPDIYKPDSGGFIVPSGNAVSRPPLEPRKIEPRGQISLLVLGGAALLGLLGVIFSFTLLPADAGAIRYIYAGLAGIVGLGGLVVLLAEWPRVNAYRNNTFMPGVLVYGTKSQMERTAGPAGLASIQMQQAKGSGTGILNKVFDRSKRLASPPEFVALHCNRGSGPEFVGIDWNSVREFHRGDIVWFHMISPWKFQLFHKLIPYAPSIVTDRDTRDEIFTALKVGTVMFKARVETKNMGKPKTMETDADGNIIVKDNAKAKAPPPPGPDDTGVPSEPQGQLLGGVDQFDLGDSEIYEDTQADPPPPPRTDPNPERPTRRTPRRPENFR
jgi:hypothetical protein